jgi:hypothetical protein
MTLENGKLQCYSKVDKKEEYKEKNRIYYSENKEIINEN